MAHTNGSHRSTCGIVLAGTYQWNGSSFEALRPRPLLPVAGKPIVEYVFEWLDGAAITDPVLCANGSTGALRRHFEGSDISSRIRYHEDGSPRGAAGCVKDAAASSQADTLIVADGTSIPTANIPRLIEHHRSSGAVLTLVVHQKGSSGRQHLEPTGTYVFERRVIDSVPATSFQDIKENLIPKLYRQGERIELFVVDEASPRVLNAATYLALNRWMIPRLVAGSGDGSTSQIVHPTAWVDKSVTMIGPVVVGPGARIYGSVTIAGPTAIGARTVIESGVVLTRSVTWEDCIIRRDAVVDQSVLADGAVVEADSYTSSAVRASVDERTPWFAHLRTPRRTTPSEALPRPALS